MPFFRQRQEGFAEESNLSDPDCEFARLGPEQVSRDANQIPEIEQLEQFVGLGADIVQLHIDLQPLARTVNVRESRLSVEAQRDNPAGYADRRLGRFERGRVGIAVLLEQFRLSCAPIEFVRIRFMPASLDFG